MRSCWELYKKEIYALSFLFLITLLITLGWELFLLYKIPDWPLGLPLALSFVPFFIYPLIMLWQGYSSFRTEWKDETIYFLLSLPRPGWQLSLVKLLAAASYLLLSSLFTLLLIFIFQQKVMADLFMDFPLFFRTSLNNILLQIILLYWINGIVIYLLSQFSQLISQFYDRFQGLISVLVFILAHYLLFRGGAILGPALKWLPDIPIQVFNDTAQGFQEYTAYVGSGPLIGSVLVLIGLFFLGSWALENHLEV